MVPHVDENTLAAIPVRLIGQLLHFDFEPVLVEHDMLLLHLRSCLVADLLYDAVCDEANDGDDADDDKEDQEGNEVLQSDGHCFCM